jgi:hypothetical protein
MRIALMQVALSETVLTVVFGVAWVRDRRRPPSQRRFGRPYKVLVVLAGMMAVVWFAIAFAIDD